MSFRASGSRSVRRVAFLPLISSSESVNPSFLWGAIPLPSNRFGWSGLVLQGEDLVWTLVESLACGFVIHLRVSLTEAEGEAFLGALAENKMEDRPVV